MSFVLSQEQVFDEARIGRNWRGAALCACIIGGNAHTTYFRGSDDKSLTAAGRYCRDTHVRYPYPGQPHGSVVDLSSVRVFADTVLLKLFSTDDVEPIEARLERIRAKSLCFRGEWRSSALLGRDCQVGDLIELSSDLLDQKFRTSIRGFIAAPQPAVLSDVIYGKGNTVKEKVKIGGDFQGTENTTYVVQVVRGARRNAGDDEEKAVLSITTTTGTDINGSVTMQTFESAPIGTKGITLAFADVEELIEGDIFYIEAAPVSCGPTQVLLLSRNVPFQLLQAEDLNLTVFINRTDVEIAEIDAEDGMSNYGVNDDGVTFIRDLRLLEPTCNDNGKPVLLSIIEADLHIEYRAWLSDMAGKVHTITTTASIEDIPGDLHPDNELKWAVNLAFRNSGVCPVSYVAVIDPENPASWVDAISKVAGDRDVYGIVPLTRDPAALQAILTHVDQQSQPMDGRERMLWVSIAAEPTVPVADASNSLDNSVLMGSVTADPDDSESLCLTVTSGNSCFMAAAVRPGDIVRYHYEEDSYENERYDEYIVSEVIHEESVRIASNQGLAPNDIPQRVEIWRIQSTDEIVGSLSEIARGYDNKRVCAVWPARVGVHNTQCDGWHLCAALAGLRSGVVPYQDLSNIELVGLTDVSQVEESLSGDQLDLLADAGVFIVAWNQGYITANAAVTTAQAKDPKQREESVVANLDSINKTLKRDMDIFFGQSGATQPTTSQLRMRLNQRITSMSIARIHRLGAQVLEGNVESVRRHAFMPGRIVINANIVVPVPGRHGLPPSDMEVRRQVIA